MATTVAMPVMNGHSHGHAHSHSRKAATTLRSSLQPTSINGGPSTPCLLKSVPHHPLHKSMQTDDNTHKEPMPSLLQLPPSFSTPTTTRSKSMERRKSVGLPTHLRLHGNGYGFPAANTQRFQTVDTEGGASTIWITLTEVITSIVIPLPYALASMAFGIGVMPYYIDLELSKSIIEDTPEFNSSTQQTVTSGWGPVCALVTLTILLVGIRGKVGQVLGGLDRRKSLSVEKREGENHQWSDTARRVVGRVLTVGLPFYAVSKLGGLRVATVILNASASHIIAQDEVTDLTKLKSWNRLLTHRRWTLLAILSQMVCDLTGVTSKFTLGGICSGYLALALAVFVLPPSFPSFKAKNSVVTSAAPNSELRTSAVLATPWETPPPLESTPATVSMISPMISTIEDLDLTLWSGAGMGLLTLITFYCSGSNAGITVPYQSLSIVLSSCAAALALTTTRPKSLRINKGLGSLLGSLLSLFFLKAFEGNYWSPFVYQSAIIGISFLALQFDTHRAISSTSRSEHHDHHHPTKSQADENARMSRFSDLLFRNTRGWPLLQSILAEKDSRRIFYFMCLNLGFMLVQTFYGIATGSLGLLSDSVHMFFDCLALAVGLCAAVMSKWPPSTRFPYGLGKMDTLAGFANGIFLMLISVEIVYEALERLKEGNKIQRLGELLTVSALGLAVNLVGMAAFGHAHHGHGHGHSHGHEDHDHASHAHGSHSHQAEHSHNDHAHHDHSHHDHDHHIHIHHDHCHDDHSPHDQSHQNQSTPNRDAMFSGTHSHGQLLSPEPTPSPSIYSSVPATPSKPAQPQSHARASSPHGHHHHHGNENMHGIFLHVLADTLGSVAVVISTLLIHFYGWSGFDPLASCLIAILIFASAVPLVASSAKTLLLTVPADIEYDLREALAGLSNLRGVTGYVVPKFWLEEGETRKVLGVIHVMTSRATDMEDVKERCIAFLKGKNMDVLVQVEREGVSRCWCQSGK